MSRRVGVLTEDQAAGFLETQGYTIVARNVAARGGELDIVALDGKVLCFVEVRARARRPDRASP